MKFKNILLVPLFFNLLCNNSLAQEAGLDLIERADFLIQNTHFEDALVMLEEALRRNPKLYQAHFKKATCFIKQNNFREAINELEKAVLIKKDYYQGYEMLGNLYYQIRKADKAVENYELAYENDENIENKLTYKLEIIELLNMLNKCIETKKHIDDAKQIVPDLFDLLFAEAKYYNEIEECESSLEIMRKIITEVEPISGNEKYFFEYGIALHYTGNYKEAAEAFEKAKGGEFSIKIRQFSPEFYFNIAQAYYQVFEYDLCEKNLDIAMSIDPNNTKIYELEKKLATIKSSKSEEIEIQTENIKHETNRNILEKEYYELALLQYQNRDYEFAISSADSSLRYNPFNLNIIFIKAMSEYRMRKADEATESLNKIVKNPRINPRTKVKFNFALGLIYENAGKYKEAIKAYKSALNGPFKYAAGQELNHLFKLMQRKEIEE